MKETEAQENKAGSKAAWAEGSYPVQFSVEYPESRSRLTVLLRLFLVIPVYAFSALLTGDLWDMIFPASAWWQDYLPFVGIFWFTPLLMIVFRQKYPLWVFGTYIELYRFSTRVAVYFLLLRDEYPSLDEQQAVSLQIEYPDVKGQLNRFLPIIKWLLAVPHLIVLIILLVAALMVTVVAWFEILIVGRYPRGLFTFVEGTFRWTTRVWCYAFMLTTDRYPPFRLGP